MNTMNKQLALLLLSMFLSISSSFAGESTLNLTGVVANDLSNALLSESPVEDSLTVNVCKLPRDRPGRPKGILCPNGACVKSKSQCRRRPPSPHQHPDHES